VKWQHVLLHYSLLRCVPAETGTQNLSRPVLSREMPWLWQPRIHGLSLPGQAKH